MHTSHIGNPNLSHPKYRPDIDGLRAIAIIAVVWFHAHPSSLRSGFIGVDIFFVISGFLISIIILNNLERNSFSLMEFYIRRIRRILPALLTVMAASLLFGWFALTGEEYEQLGKHIAGGAAFISNLLLWSESGYFDTAAETKPMLHLWSLAIEEQFYIFWPLVLALAWRNHKSFLATIATIAAASFAYSIYLIGIDKTGAFYSPLSRFWELMAGSMLAYIALHRRELIHRYPNPQSIAGFVLLVGGLALINRWHDFPGLWALLPVLGTVLIISAGPSAWLNRTILANKALVSIGLISYPLYLWHWPLLSFMKIIMSQELALHMAIATVVASVVLAWLTYRFIERPCRFGKFRLTTSALLLLGLLVCGIGAYLIYAAHGITSRASAPSLHAVNHGTLGHGAYLAKLKPFPHCGQREVQKAAMPWGCMQSSATADPEIVIIGDSHAQHTFLGLAEAAKGRNVMFYMQDDLPTADNPGFKAIFDYVRHTPAISRVILTAFWNWRIRNDADATHFTNSLRATVQALLDAGKQIYIIASDIPHFSFDPGKCKFSGRLGLGFGPVNQCSESSASYLAEKRQNEALINRAINGLGADVRLIDLAPLFCHGGACGMASDGVLFYRDRNHLNASGSRYIGAAIAEIIDQKAPPR